MRLHHVQVSCPPGGEDGARRFYAGALGLSEADKPEPLAGRGGAWFRAYDEDRTVVAELHVGLEDAFVPARRAHPAFLVEDLAAVVQRLRAGGFEVDERERDTFPGYVRVHTRDAAGNRVELLEKR